MYDKNKENILDIKEAIEKIKGTYLLDTDKFKIKIRNIAGDEIVIDAKELRN